MFVVATMKQTLYTRSTKNYRRTNKRTPVTEAVTDRGRSSLGYCHRLPERYVAGCRPSGLPPVTGSVTDQNRSLARYAVNYRLSGSPLHIGYPDRLPVGHHRSSLRCAVGRGRGSAERLSGLPPVWGDLNCKIGGLSADRGRCLRKERRRRRRGSSSSDGSSSRSARSLPGANEGEVFGVIVEVVLWKAMCRRHLAGACRLLEVGATVGVLTPAGTKVEIGYLTAPRRGIVYRKVGEGTPQSLLQKLDA